tara:strand:- start:857 stop:2245 length:1389 start_codon:yes stop_codon:yes gene_type:complete
LKFLKKVISLQPKSAFKPLEATPSQLTPNMSIETTLQTFIDALYAEHSKKLPKQAVTEEFLKTYIEDLNTKKLSSRAKTLPGDVFNSDLCRCRVWNKGYAKQCSSAHKEDGICTAHNKKISQYNGWAFGFYDEEKPDKYLFDNSDKKTGHSLKWKDASKAPSKVLTPKIKALKTEYKKILGRDPKGPKANNAEWLQTKIDEYDPDEPVTKKSSGKKVSHEVKALKDEYTKVFGIIPKGPKANDTEWLKMKIKDEKIQSESSNDEDHSSDEENNDEEKIKDKKEVKDEESENESDDEEESEDKTDLKAEQSNKSSLDSDFPPPHPDGVEAKKRKEKKKEVKDEESEKNESDEEESEDKMEVKDEESEKNESDEESEKNESDEEESEDKKANDDKKIKPLELELDIEGEKFDFEGIEYWKRKEDSKKNVYNADDMLVGRWSKKKNTIQFDENWKECHDALVNDM